MKHRKILSLVTAFAVCATMGLATSSTFATTKNVSGFTKGVSYTMNKTEKVANTYDKTKTFTDTSKTLSKWSAQNSTTSSSFSAGGKSYKISVIRQIRPGSIQKTRRVWQPAKTHYKKTYETEKGTASAIYTIDYPTISGWARSVSTKTQTVKDSTQSTVDAVPNITMNSKRTNYSIGTVSRSVKSEKKQVVCVVKLPKTTTVTTQNQENGKLTTQTTKTTDTTVVTITYKKK